MQKRKLRNGELDFLRFIFSLLILVHHSYFINNRINYFKGGYIGVEFFFLTSGYLMMKTFYSTKHAGSIDVETLLFVKHKIMGMLPNIWIAWFIIFVHAHLDKSKYIIINDLGYNIWELLLLPLSGLGEFMTNGLTWYISAMLLSMILLYPLLLRFNGSSLGVIFFFISIFGQGYLYQKFGNLAVGNVWNGNVMCGLVRASSEICGGGILYWVSEHLKQMNFTRIAAIFFSSLEYIIILFVFSYTYSKGMGQADFIILLLIFIAVVICVSRIGILNSVFNKELFFWLGKYSFSLYLGQAFSSIISHNMIQYITYSFLTGLTIMYLSVLVKKTGCLLYSETKKFFIKE